MYRKTAATVEEVNERLKREAAEGNVRYWIDRDGQLEPALDLGEWAKRLDDWSLKCVAEDKFEAPLRGAIRLVTIFNGMDPNGVLWEGPPQLYSTAVFYGEGVSVVDEWWTATRAEALAQHQSIKAQLERGELIIHTRGLGDMP